MDKCQYLVSPAPSTYPGMLWKACKMNALKVQTALATGYAEQAHQYHDLSPFLYNQAKSRLVIAFQTDF